MKLRYLLLFPLVMFSCTNEIDDEKPNDENGGTNQETPIDPISTDDDSDWLDFFAEHRDSLLNILLVDDSISRAKCEEYGIPVDRNFYSYLGGLEDFSNDLKLLTRWNGRDDLTWTYETMKLLMMTNNKHDNFGIVVGTDEYWNYLAFQRNTTTEIDSVVQAVADKGISIVFNNYIYAGVREGAYICADKKLFGREAGEPLNDKFSVTSESKQTWIRVSYPDYHVIANGYEEELPTEFDEVFKAGTALYPGFSVNYGYVLSLKEIPAEQYDNVTFKLSIPVEGEYFGKKFNHCDYEERDYLTGRVEWNRSRWMTGFATVKLK